MNTTVKMLLISMPPTKFGTFGIIKCGGAELYTLEPQPNFEGINYGLIPEGRYDVVRGELVEDIYEWYVTDVPGRHGIRITIGNTQIHTHGSILLGKGLGAYNSDWCITQSVEANELFDCWLEEVEDFTLEIIRPPHLICNLSIPDKKIR